ncbi:hypothetical protein DMO16_23715 [Fictibacillus sp. S7]|nr:hypothetical protein DMO16_23715 [Fictibacillus sp. S7]
MVLKKRPVEDLELKTLEFTVGIRHFIIMQARSGCWLHSFVINSKKNSGMGKNQKTTGRRGLLMKKPSLPHAYEVKRDWGCSTRFSSECLL